MHLPLPLLLAALLGASAPAIARTAIVLDPADSGRVFDGIGAVSAGATTRLLPDYPEPQRSQILDYLFKPDFGAGFQHLKVEIGCGENSTSGSEPTHVLTRAELPDPKPRGYEFWLLAEARRRNPQIILDCLPWGYPAWVSSPYSQDSADWIASFLELARRRYGLEINWVSAGQNEKGTDAHWVSGVLRPTLDARGFRSTRLQSPDNDKDFWKVFAQFPNDPAFNQAVRAVGYHYVDGREPWSIDQVAGRDATVAAKRSGKPLWASEEWSRGGGHWDDDGALYVTRLINKLYIRDRITTVEFWCPINSIYDAIVWGDTGAMRANEPWSGHYEVWPTVWAFAHTTQFVKPGWRYLDHACGQFSPKTWRGSYVTLCAPNHKDWSMIAVTGDAVEADAELRPGLSAGSIHVWKSVAAEQFIQQPDITPRSGHFALHLEANAIYSFTTTTGQQKGTWGTPPPSAPFPLPYREDFEHTRAGDTPRYLSDQKGTFEVVDEPGHGRCLAQIVPKQGTLWTGPEMLKPYTLFGNPAWRNYVLAVDVRIVGGDVELGSRFAGSWDGRDKLGYRWIVSHDGAWRLNWERTTLAHGILPHFDPSRWHRLKLAAEGAQIRGYVDDELLATVADKSQSSGLAFLASTYDRNLFDNLSVTTP